MRLLYIPKPTFTFETIVFGTLAAFVICYLFGFVAILFLTSQMISTVSFSVKLPIVESAFKILTNANAQLSADRLLFTTTFFLVVAVVSAILMFFCGVTSREKIPPFHQTIKVLWILLFFNLILAVFTIFPDRSGSLFSLSGLIYRTDVGYLFFGGGFQFTLSLCFLSGNFIQRFSLTSRPN